MQIELTQQELHEIRCGLARNRSRIKNKLEHAKKSLEKYGGGVDSERELYFSTLVTLREKRIERISEMLTRFEQYG